MNSSSPPVNMYDMISSVLLCRTQAMYTIDSPVDRRMCMCIDTVLCTCQSARYRGLVTRPLTRSGHGLRMLVAATLSDEICSCRVVALPWRTLSQGHWATAVLQCSVVLQHILQSGGGSYFFHLSVPIRSSCVEKSMAHSCRTT